MVSTASNRYRHSRQIHAAPQRQTPLTQAGSATLRGTLAVLAVIVLIFSAFGYYSVGKVGSQIAGASNLELGEGGGLQRARDGATDILSSAPIPAPTRRATRSPMKKSRSCTPAMRRTTTRTR